MDALDVTKLTTLVVDHRERAIIPYVDAIFCDQFITTSMQLTVGDYQIFRGDHIFACIERKTYKDFAQSFTDGRYKNMEKMIDLRARLALSQPNGGCKLYLLLEGAMWQEPKHKYGAIPVASITTACDDMMTRDDIHIIYSRDQESTADMLLRLMFAYDKIDLATIGGNDDTTCSNSYTLPPTLAEKSPKKTLQEQLIAMWSQLPGISAILGTVLAQKYAAADILEGHVKIDEIRGFNERLINKQARESLTALMNGDQAMINRLVGGMPGISEATAKKLNLSKQQLIDSMEDELAELSNGMRKMGIAKATTVYKCVHYKATD